MKYEFEKVIEGVSKYINANIIPGMNDVQEVAARIMIARVFNNQESLKEYLVSNGFVRTFGVLDREGMVDVESILRDVKTEISRKEKICISVPFFGRMTFKSSDVDELYKMIREEAGNDEAN